VFVAVNGDLRLQIRCAHAIGLGSDQQPEHDQHDGDEHSGAQPRNVEPAPLTSTSCGHTSRIAALVYVLLASAPAGRAVRSSRRSRVRATDAAARSTTPKRAAS
jgi:hypothetical protein